MKYQSAASYSTDTQNKTIEGMFSCKVQEHYGPRHETQVKLTSSLVNNLLIGCGLPVSLVEKEAFRRFFLDVDPKYRLPSRCHVTDKLIPQAKEKQVVNVNSQLEEARHVSLTVDIWTDRRMHSYIAITVHLFINWEAKSHLLHFKAFKGSHTGARIAAEVEKAIDEHGLRGKVVHIVSDNASNMRKAFELLQQKAVEDGGVEDEGTMPVGEDDMLDDETLFEDLEEDDDSEVNQVIHRHCLSRLSCFAHSLQLAIKDAMEKCVSARPVMAKCSKMANCCHQSAVFREQFEVNFGEGRSIPSTNATRWSSLYHQVSSIVQLDEQLLTALLRQTGHDNLILTAKDMASLKEFVVILQPFSEVRAALW